MAATGNDPVVPPNYLEQFVESGQLVETGIKILLIEDPELSTEVDLLYARLAEYQVRYEMALPVDRIESALIKDELERIEAELVRAREREQALLVKNATPGIFVYKGSSDLSGHLVRRGTLLGYVIDPHQMIVRVVVPQKHIEQVRDDVRSVEVRLTEQVEQVLPATVIREVPEASNILPSVVLSLEGGGSYVLDPRSSDKPKALERFFQFDLSRITAGPAPCQPTTRHFADSNNTTSRAASEFRSSSHGPKS